MRSTASASASRPRIASISSSAASAGAADWSAATSSTSFALARWLRMADQAIASAHSTSIAAMMTTRIRASSSGRTSATAISGPTNQMIVDSSSTPTRETNQRAVRMETILRITASAALRGLEEDHLDPAVLGPAVGGVVRDQRDRVRLRFDREAGVVLDPVRQHPADRFARASESCQFDGKRRFRIGWLSVWPSTTTWPGSVFSASPMRTRIGLRSSVTVSLAEANSPLPLIRTRVVCWSSTTVTRPSRISGSRKRLRRLPEVSSTILGAGGGSTGAGRSITTGPTGGTWAAAAITGCSVPSRSH